MNYAGRFVAILGLVGLSACVSASKHKDEVAALQGQIDQDKEGIKNLNQELLTVNKNLAKAIGDLSTANGDLTKAKNDLAMAKNDLAKANEVEKSLISEKSKLQEKLADTANDRGQLRASLNEMKKAMDEMNQRQSEQQKRLKEFADLTRRFKKLTDSGTLSIKIIDGKMVVTLGSDVLFPSGSAKISAAGLESIKEVTAQLAAIKGKRFQIEGHTDNVPIANAAFPSNWELASARALTVVRAMIDFGMPNERVSAASYGETQPVKDNGTQEGRAANRRIAIVVVPDLSSLPGYDELNKLGGEN